MVSGLLTTYQSKASARSSSFWPSARFCRGSRLKTRSRSAASLCMSMRYEAGKMAKITGGV